MREGQEPRMTPAERNRTHSLLNLPGLPIIIYLQAMMLQTTKSPTKPRVRMQTSNSILRIYILHQPFPPLKNTFFLAAL